MLKRPLVPRQIPESECPEGAGAPLILTSTPDDSDDEPGVGNTHLFRKQFPEAKRSQVSKFGSWQKNMVGQRPDLSMILTWKILESQSKGRKTLKGWIEASIKAVGYYKPVTQSLVSDLSPTM